MSELLTNLTTVNQPRPFIRWVGGKSWLLPLFNELVDGRHFNKYFEPFLGGGSIYFGFDRFKRAILSDLNPELINTYQWLSEYPDEVIRLLKNIDRDEASYYKLRDNVPQNSIDRAARFLYLNYHSFNGIYRVNSQGKYNVPFGRRNQIEYDVYDFQSISLKLKNAEILCCDFKAVSKRIKKNDLVYLDPPYTVSHNHNGFIEYNEKIFRLDDQHRLNRFIESIEKKGAYFILSNADHVAIQSIFSRPSRRMLRVRRPNKIGGINAKRGQTTELIYTNLGK
jgi:DNA adenine methylase